MVETFKPDSEAALEKAIAWAVAEEQALSVLGHGTKQGLGRPPSHNAGDAAYALDLSDLSGVVEYEPAELVLTAKAATPMAEIAELVSQNGQMLAFEPSDLGPAYGRSLGGGTLGGVIASNLSGPRRIKAGAARDHVLGFRAVSGRGEIFKSGGKVVKNVTGYDLAKLITGSFGTLAVMSEITIKVLPAPEKTHTVLLFGLSPDDGVRAMTAALNSPHEVSGAVFLPKDAARCSAVDYVASAGASVTALRLEGVGPSVKARCESLTSELSAIADHQEELHSTRSITFWSEITGLLHFPEQTKDGVAGADRALWRISLPPSDGAGLVDVLLSQMGASNPHYTMDWGGGLVTLELDAGEDAMARVIRSTLNGRGHATLIAAPDLVRANVDVFEPQVAPLAALSSRVKEQFDPHRVLNPGRMYAGV